MKHIDAMIDVDEILRRLGVRYWVAFGTVLGLHREGDIIKGDTDVDYSCRTEDMVKIAPKIAKAFKKRGYKVELLPEAKRVRIIAVRGKVTVAIAGFRERSGYRVRKTWKVPTKFFGDGCIEYKGHSFPCHSPIEEYLEWVYRDWRTPMSKDVGHRRIYTENVSRCMDRLK